VDFEWDAVKEFINLRKHKVSFAEAVESFLDPNGLQLVDRKHSRRELRLYWVGKSSRGTILTTWFTRRDDKIRIIGCAEMRRFRRLYDETTKAE
jgi:uncharacterized DUF497 family protein